MRDAARDKLPLLAAALSFFAMMAAIPLFAIAVLASAFLLGSGEWARGWLFAGAQSAFGDRRAEALDAVIRGATPGAGDAWTLALGVLLFGSALWQLFGTMEVAMNRIWDVEAAPKGRLAALVRKRVLSYGMLLGLALLLLMSLGLSSALAAFLPAHALAWELARIGGSLLLSWVVLAALYHHLPDAEVGWREAARGGLAAALLLTLGERLLGAILGSGGVASVYGGLAGVALALLWFYYTSLLVLLGAELTQVLGTARTGAPPPEPIARPRGEKHGERGRRAGP